MSTGALSLRGGLTLRDFRDAHRDESVIVCGCGESLNTLGRADRFVTIGVNDVGRRLVFDKDWKVVALHHGGGSAVRRLDNSGGRYAANEGIAIPAVQEGITAFFARR